MTYREYILRNTTTKEQRRKAGRRNLVILGAILVVMVAILILLGAGEIPESAKLSADEHLVVTERSAPVSTPEPTPKPVETAPPYTEEQLEILAMIIYGEAGGDACSDDTRMKVGNVFLNRVADERYPDTFREVALQKAQYGRLYWTGLVWPGRTSSPNEAHAVERAYSIARRLLEGERVLPGDVVFQSEHIQGAEIVAHQDGLYFCR